MFVINQNGRRSPWEITKLFSLASTFAALTTCPTSTGVDGFPLAQIRPDVHTATVLATRRSPGFQTGTAYGNCRSWQTPVKNPRETGTWHAGPFALARLLAAKDGGGGGGGKKRRRKRKRKQNQQPQASQIPSTSGGGAGEGVTGAAEKIRPPGQGEVVTVTEAKKGDNVKSTSSGGAATIQATTSTSGDTVETAKKSASAPPAPSPKDATPMKKLSFDRSEALALGIEDATDPDDIPPEFASLRKDKPSGSLPQLTELSAGRTGASSRGAVELPDIKDSVKRKKTKKETTQVDDDSQEKESEQRIQRKDVASFTKLLEIEPNADTDSSYFVEEEYGTVSALLGEGARSFLGIPLPILQVGHFIGALGIILCAFVEYPGFPLTNLPSVVRGSLQGGLGTVYAINTVLAILAAFKAGERGQPMGLWIAKTFTVGGLAYDQLMQLPTTDEIDAARRGKGKGKRKRG